MLHRRRRHPRRARLTARRREALTAYAFLSPWMIGFVGLTAIPMGASLLLSFTDYGLLDPGAARWTGLANYRQALGHDPLVRQSLMVTTYYAFLAVALELVLGFALALVLNVGFRGARVVRTIYYLPAVISGVAVSLLWLWILQPSSGLANRALGLVGLPQPGWFYSTRWVIPAFVIMSLWGVGRSAFIYLAILQRIPTNLYEAAAVDGIGPLGRLLRITLPLSTPAVFLNLVIGLIGHLQIFTEGYVITSGHDGPGALTLGGPGTASLFYVLYMYVNAFRYFQFGYASALGWILFTLIMALTLVVFRSGRRWVYYEGGAHG